MVTLKIRLLNFGIDSIAFFLLVILIGLLAKNFIPQDYFKFFMIGVYYLYYLLCETLTGRTIGKFLTNTAVVDSESGFPASFGQILLRTFLRMVPIDAFSYLFSAQGIHDNLSKTKLRLN